MKYIFFACSILAGISLKGQALQDTVGYAKGLVPAQYVFVDTAGVQHTLKEFSGKYVYLDIWASWCAPCRKEYPFLRELEAKLDPGKVSVVSISIDDRDFRWKGAMAGYGMSEGRHWMTVDTMFKHDFRIDRIPRFILLDKKGKVQTFSMNRPSDEQLITTLNKLKLCVKN